MDSNIYGDTVTLFSSAGKGSAAKWTPFVLKNVGLEELIGEKLRQTAFSNVGAARLFIPAGTGCEQALLYMRPSVWQNAKEEEREGRWTLQPGDVFVPGTVEREIIKSPSELDSDGVEVYIIARIEAFLPPCFSDRLAHWELTTATELKGVGRRWGY